MNNLILSCKILMCIYLFIIDTWLGYEIIEIIKKGRGTK